MTTADIRLSLDSDAHRLVTLGIRPAGVTAPAPDAFWLRPRRAMLARAAPEPSGDAVWPAGSALGQI